MAKLIVQWTDPRPKSATVQYRLVKDSASFMIERCERDSLDGDRWVVVATFPHTGFGIESNLLLSHAIERLSGQLSQARLPSKPEDDVNPMSFIGYGRGDD